MLGSWYFDKLADKIDYDIVVVVLILIAVGTWLF